MPEDEGLKKRPFQRWYIVTSAESCHRCVLGLTYSANYEPSPRIWHSVNSYSCHGMLAWKAVSRVSKKSFSFQGIANSKENPHPQDPTDI